MDQTLNSLDGFDPVSRCDALHYLLQNLKFKYPETCEQVVPSVFSHLLDRDYASTTKGASKKQLQLLLATKKEDIKIEDENASSTDLNQNFEKILCKEEFMCLDEDDADYADDADNENSNFLNKRVRRYASSAGASNAAAVAASSGQHLSVGAGSRDPLDLIPSSVIHARRLGRIASAADNGDGDESNSLDALASDSLKRARRRGFNHSKSHLGKIHQSRLLFEKLQRISHLGEGYVFHPDNEFTIHFHWRSEELSIRVFKEQFRLHLRIALRERNKEFLRQFQQDLVFTGQLLGTTPPKHVLDALRLEREEEWRQQKIRRQQIQQQQMLHMQQRRRMFAASNNAGNPYDSEMDFELESESQLSSASHEIMKFEEIIDEGVGPGRLIDGLVMEPEIEDVIERGSGASVSVSGGSSNSSGGNGLDTLPNDLVTTDSASTLTSPFVGGSDTAVTGGASFKNHISQQQQG